MAAAASHAADDLDMARGALVTMVKAMQADAASASKVLLEGGAIIQVVVNILQGPHAQTEAVAASGMQLLHLLGRAQQQAAGLACEMGAVQAVSGLLRHQLNQQLCVLRGVGSHRAARDCQCPSSHLRRAKHTSAGTRTGNLALLCGCQHCCHSAPSRCCPHCWGRLRTCNKSRMRSRRVYSTPVQLCCVLNQMFRQELQS